MVIFQVRKISNRGGVSEGGGRASLLAPHRVHLVRRQQQTTGFLSPPLPVMFTFLPFFLGIRENWVAINEHVRKSGSGAY